MGFETLTNPLKHIRKPSGGRARDRRLRFGEFEASHTKPAAIRGHRSPLSWPSRQACAKAKRDQNGSMQDIASMDIRPTLTETIRSTELLQAWLGRSPWTSRYKFAFKNDT